MFKKWINYANNLKGLCEHWFDYRKTYWFEKYGWKFFYCYMVLRFIFTGKPSLILCNFMIKISIFAKIELLSF